MKLYKSELRKKEVFVYNNLEELKKHREHMLSNGFMVTSFSHKVFLNYELMKNFRVQHPNVTIYKNTTSYFEADYFIYTCTYEKNIYSNYHEEETA